MNTTRTASRFSSVARSDYALRDIRNVALGEEIDLSAYEILFARNAVARRPGQLDWQQVANPNAKGGAVVIANATPPDPSHDDGLGAVYAAMGVGFQIDGNPVLGAQSLDTLTDVNHRKKGLFTDLACTAYAGQQAAGVKLVYGFPNGSSCHGFTRKLEWKLLDPIPFVVRPLRTGYLARRFSRKLKWMDLPIPVLGNSDVVNGVISPVSEFGSSHDELWSRIRADIGVSVDRTSEYMTWRLFGRPNSDCYRIAALHVNGVLEGEIAWTVAEKHGGSIGYIMELLHNPIKPEYGTALMRHALRAMASEGAEIVLAWNDSGSFNASAHRAAGFMTFPAKLQPIELHWGVVALGSDAEATRIYDRSEWYISYLDSDTV